MSEVVKKKNYLDLLPLFLIQIVWGSYFFIAKDLQKEINVFFLHFLRFSLLTIILLPWGIKYIKEKKLIIGGIITGLMLAASNYLLNIGLNISSSVNAAFLVGLAVVFTPLAEFLIFRKKMNPFRITAVIAAFIGFWFVTGGVKGFDIGDIVLTVSTLFSTFHVISADQNLTRKSHFIPFTFWQMLVCAIAGLLLNSLFGNFNLPELNVMNVGAFLYLALISMGLGMLVLMWTQGRVNAVIISVMFLLETTFGAAFGWTFGHERFFLAQAIGGVIIIISMLVTVLSDKDADLKSLD